MSLKQLKLTLKKLQESLIKRSYYADKDDSGMRTRNYDAMIGSSVKQIEDLLWNIVGEVETKEDRLELFVLLNNMKKARDIRTMLMVISRMEDIIGDVKDRGEIKFDIQKIPEDVKEEVVADMDELKKCYEAKCYRSCIIICGRLLEVALHRKYFEVTKTDLLEKSPGIGLGNLIAKLVEKNVKLVPGLTQQIHLINNVRIFSVHKKKEVFKPSKAQTNAIILFTLDTLEKLF
jgi:hypothetical protein